LRAARNRIAKPAFTRLTPLLKDANERARVEVRRRAILSEVRQTGSIERGANDQVHVVHDHGPFTATVNDCLALSNSQR